MTPPHSTQSTFPALRSSSETQSEITRLCVQAEGGLIGSGRGACSGSLRFTGISGTHAGVAAAFSHHDRLVSAMQDGKYGNVDGSLLMLSVVTN
jgi:hypothetical protein